MSTETDIRIQEVKAGVRSSGLDTASKKKKKKKDIRLNKISYVNRDMRKD